MTGFIPLSVSDNRKLSTSGTGRNKRYYCDGVEIGKETYDLIVFNRKKAENAGGSVSQKKAIYRRLAE